MVRVVIALLLIVVPSVADAQLRHALLIGNQGYGDKVGALKNPHNDIRTVGKALEGVGFKVTSLREASRRQVLSAVKIFAAELAKGGPSAVGFFYYSGHGVSRPDDRANYLIPIDLKDTDSTDFWFDAVKLDDILGELERAAPFAAHFIVFDACRNELKLPEKTAVKGFEPVAERSGMFIAFATALGAVASDRGTISGPYASALAVELAKPGQDHLQLFQNVKEGVFSSTGRRQVPWERNGLLRRVYFGGEATKPLQPQQTQISEASQAWALVKETTDARALEAFRRQYGAANSFFDRLAEARLEELKKRQLAVASPPSKPKPAEKGSKKEDSARAAQAQRDFLEGERYSYGRGVARDYRKARELYEKSAAAGNAGGTNALGVLYQNGWGGPQNYVRARELFEKAAALGNAYGMANVGWLYREGLGVSRDYSRAREWFEKAVALGNGGGMNNLGLLYQFGEGVPKDYVKARQWYEKAVATGGVHGMTNLGWLYRDGLGVQRNYATARGWFEKSTALGDSFGMMNLGWLYLNGWGVSQDPAKGLDLYNKSIAAGNAYAMADLGWFYQEGKGVARDYTKAREWFEKAAAVGNGRGMNGLGALHEYGQGTPKDLRKAQEWYEKSAAAGNDFGMNNLGRCYQFGWSVPQDDAKAREWYERAAALGNRYGTGNLAWFLDQGKGGPVDFPRAAKLLLEAVRGNNEGMIEALGGDMGKWSQNTRTELKRELALLGHYKGAIEDKWDDQARAAVKAYLVR